MKYLIVVDDNMVSNFRTDDNGLTLVVTDKTGFKRGMKMKPICRPMLVNDEGSSVYLTQGHIDAFLEYEREETFKLAMERLDILK